MALLQHNRNVFLYLYSATVWKPFSRAQKCSSACYCKC